MASVSVTASDSAKVDVCIDICAQLPTAVVAAPRWRPAPQAQASLREAAAWRTGNRCRALDPRTMIIRTRKTQVTQTAESRRLTLDGMYGCWIFDVLADIYEVHGDTTMSAIEPGLRCVVPSRLQESLLSVPRGYRVINFDKSFKSDSTFKHNFGCRGTRSGECSEGLKGIVDGTEF
ncbi:hypothetical protein A0H81_14694 [Grifola frondosa]|uniref:Uncharacterized protein n=1 Tax=Grifola frondosa TaxID=5627 RepID=A0A1C7LKF8_GRIFR|nr:hypothetical protein A0H81_14694 [Grifola frondosa]